MRFFLAVVFTACLLAQTGSQSAPAGQADQTRLALLEDAVRRIDDRLQRLEEKVTSLQVQSAGIDTKLNFALAIIGPVSLAILGGVITLLVNRKTETAKPRFVYPESELNRLLDLDDNDLRRLTELTDRMRSTRRRVHVRTPVTEEVPPEREEKAPTPGV